MAIIETQKKKAEEKLEVKILPFPGLVWSGSEQPGPGATLLGWPKSISYKLKKKKHITFILSFLGVDCTGYIDVYMTQ